MGGGESQGGRESARPRDQEEWGNPVGEHFFFLPIAKEGGDEGPPRPIEIVIMTKTQDGGNSGGLKSGEPPGFFFSSDFLDVTSFRSKPFF